MPTVVVVGPWLNVKEQVASNYAQRLAQKGFAALAFDFRHWGESGGQPRAYESPKNKIEDIGAAIAFLQTRPEVDADHIGLLGVCFGVGYVAAAAKDPAVKSVGTVAAWVHDVPSVTALFGEAEVTRRRQAAAEARVAYAKDQSVVVVPAASSTDAQAAMFVPNPSFYYLDAERGGVPQWTNRYAVLGWDEWLDFDGVSLGANITQPLMSIHSDGSALPDNLRRFYGLAKGPKELVWMEGEHTQFYDKAPFIDRAVEALAGHYSRTLLSPSERDRVRAESLAATREFFAALEAKDIKRFLDVWSDDGVQEMPYSPEGFPKVLRGKSAIEEQYGGLPDNFASMKFPLSRITGTDDPRTVIAEFRGDIAVNATGGKYDNQYVGVFTFDGAGKLVRYSEYFDPNILAQAFGTNLSRNFGVGPAGEPEAAARDRAAIESLIDEVGALADAREWDQLRARFADTVHVDYTSLAGGEPADVRADDLIAAWKPALSRFARTKHLVGDKEVVVEGATAKAKASVAATHTRDADGKDRWTVGGNYAYRFAKEGAHWKVTSITFNLEWEQGSRG